MESMIFFATENGNVKLLGTKLYHYYVLLHAMLFNGYFMTDLLFIMVHSGQGTACIVLTIMPLCL